MVDMDDTRHIEHAREQRNKRLTRNYLALYALATRSDIGGAGSHKLEPVAVPHNL